MMRRGSPVLSNRWTQASSIGFSTASESGRAGHDAPAADRDGVPRRRRPRHDRGPGVTVQKADPDIAISTIYRTMEAFEEVGAVEHLHLGHGPAVYHLVDQGHHHLVCDGCGKTIEVPDATVAPSPTASAPSTASPSMPATSRCRVAVRLRIDRLNGRPSSIGSRSTTGPSWTRPTDRQRNCCQGPHCVSPNSASRNQSRMSDPTATSLGGAPCPGWATSGSVSGDLSSEAEPAAEHRPCPQRAVATPTGDHEVAAGHRTRRTPRRIRALR